MISARALVTGRAAWGEEEGAGAVVFPRASGRLRGPWSGCDLLEDVSPHSYIPLSFSLEE